MQWVESSLLVATPAVPNPSFSLHLRHSAEMHGWCLTRKRGLKTAFPGLRCWRVAPTRTCRRWRQVRRYAMYHGIASRVLLPPLLARRLDTHSTDDEPGRPAWTPWPWPPVARPTGPCPAPSVCFFALLRLPIAPIRNHKRDSTKDEPSSPRAPTPPHPLSRYRHKRQHRRSPGPQTATRTAPTSGEKTTGERAMAIYVPHMLPSKPACKAICREDHRRRRCVRSHPRPPA
jgi:hypothetical protein